MMKRWQWIIILVCLAYATGAVQALPTVSIQDITLTPGETAITRVTVSDVTDLGTIALDLAYDPAVMHVTGVSGGGFDTGPLSNYNNTFGTARIGAFQIQNAGLAGTATVCEIAIVAVGAAGSSTPLRIVSATLTDATPAGAQIEASLRSGQVNIAGTPTPVPESGGNDPEPTATPHVALVTKSLRERMDRTSATGTIPIAVTGEVAALIEYLETGSIDYALSESPNTVACTVPPATITDLAQQTFVTIVALGTVSGSPAATPEPTDVYVAASGATDEPTPTAVTASTATTTGSTASPTTSASTAAPGFSIWLALAGVLLVFILRR